MDIAITVRFVSTIVQSACVVVVLVALLGGCASAPSAPPPAPGMPEAEKQAIRDRLAQLDAKGAADFLSSRYHEAAFAVDSASDKASWRRAEDMVAAVERDLDGEITSQTQRAFDAYRVVNDQRKELERFMPRAAECPRAASALEEATGVIRAARTDLYGSSEDSRLALKAQKEVQRSNAKLSEALAEAAVCGVVQAGPSTNPLLLQAARRLSEDGHYGHAVRVLEAVATSAPESADGVAAAERMKGLGGEQQKVVMAEVDAAVMACNGDMAQTKMKGLDDLVVALSKHAPELVDPEVSRGLPKLRQRVKSMIKTCPGMAAATDKPVEVAELEGADFAIEEMVRSGRLAEARQAVSGLPAGERRDRLQRLVFLEETIVQAQNERDSGKLSEAINLYDGVLDVDSTGQVAFLLADSLAARAQWNLGQGRNRQAAADAERAASLSSDGAVLESSAGVLSSLGRAAAAAGDTDTAIRRYRSAVNLIDLGTDHLELARLLAGRGDFKQASRHLTVAIRQGVEVDLSTRLNVMVVAGILGGDAEGAWKELEAVARSAGGDDDSVGDLAVHALRLPAYTDLGSRVAGTAGSGGQIRGSKACMVFAGSDTGGLSGSLAEAVDGAGVSAVGFSADFRYLAASGADRQGVAVFDARGGRAAAAVASAGAPSATSPLVGLAVHDVVLAVAPFLAREAAGILDQRGVGRAELTAQMDALMESLAGRSLAYALVADTSGNVRNSAGFSGPGPDFKDPPSQRAGGAKTVMSHATEYEGRSFLEVVVPIEVGGGSRGVLRLGVEADLEAIKANGGGSW